MQSTFLLVSFALAISTSQAARVTNDWSQPCFNHTCTYHLPEDGPGAGTLTLWGPPGKISDITPAAGWEIMDCDKDKLEQDIRIVCTDEAGCDHLHSHGGPEGKIVRLPESCGQMAFALIKRSWIHEDQSIPHHIARRLSKRQQPPLVLGKRITHEVASPATKDVKFEAIGTTTRRQNGEMHLPDHVKAESVIHAADGQGVAVLNKTGIPEYPLRTKRADDSPEVHRRNVHAPRGLLNVLGKGVGWFTKLLFHLSGSNLERVIPLKTHFPETIIASVEVDCGLSRSATKLSAYGDGDIQALVGVHMKGDLDGNMEQAEAYIQVKGNIKGGVNMEVNLNGHYGPFESRIFQHPLDILDFGRIFTVGPKFEVIGLVEGDLNLKAELKYDFEYTMDDLRLSFPPDKGPSSFKPKTSESPLKLNVDQSIQASGKFVTHIVPRLMIDFGLSSSLHATMFVAADIGIAATFGIDAHLRPVVGFKPIDPGKTAEDVTEHPSEVENTDAAGSNITNTDFPDEASKPPTKDAGLPAPDSEAYSTNAHAHVPLNSTQSLKPNSSSTVAPSSDHEESIPPTSLTPSLSPPMNNRLPKGSVNSSAPTTPIVAQHAGNPNEDALQETQKFHVKRRSPFHHHSKGLRKRLLKLHNRLRSADDVIGEPVESQSLLKTVPDLKTTFGLLSNDMSISTCFFAQPSLRIFAGIEADARIVDFARLLGFGGLNAFTVKSFDLYSVKFPPINVLQGDGNCPVGPPSSEDDLHKMAIPSGLLRPPGQQAQIASRQIGLGLATCAVSAKAIEKETAMSNVQYTLPKLAELITSPKVDAGNGMASLR